MVLFFVGPMLLGIGGSNPGGGGAPAASQPAEELTPTPIPTEKPAPTPQVYIVARGDTMLKIAKKFGVTMEALLAANPKIKNPNKIGVGDPINIPVPEADAGNGGVRRGSRRRSDRQPRIGRDRRGAPGASPGRGALRRRRQRENGVRLIEVILPASTRNWASRCWLGAPGRRTTRSAW